MCAFQWMVTMRFNFQIPLNNAEYLVRPRLFGLSQTWTSSSHKNRQPCFFHWPLSLCHMSCRGLHLLENKQIVTRDVFLCLVVIKHLHMYSLTHWSSSVWPLSFEQVIHCIYRATHEQTKHIAGSSSFTGDSSIYSNIDTAMYNTSVKIKISF